MALFLFSCPLVFDCFVVTYLLIQYVTFCQTHVCISVLILLSSHKSGGRHSNEQKSFTLVKLFPVAAAGLTLGCYAMLVVLCMVKYAVPVMHVPVHVVIALDTAVFFVLIVCMVAVVIMFVDIVVSVFVFCSSQNMCSLLWFWL